MLMRATVTLLLLGVAPLSAQQDYMARARPLLGCWAMSVGTYTPAQGRDSTWVHPPRIMKVDTTPGQGMMDNETFGWLVAGAVPPIERHWRGAVGLGNQDSIVLFWTRGLGALQASVKVAADTAQGWITLIRDTGDGSPMARLVMTRTRCP